MAGADKPLIELAQQAAAALESAVPTTPQILPELQVTEQDIDDVLRKSNRNAELSNDPVIREKIRQRILESLQRKAAMLKLVCPACGVTITKLEAMSKHTAHCCPDILPPKAVQQCAAAADQGALQQLMSDAAAAEQRLRRKAIEITFLASDPEGDKLDQELSASSFNGAQDSGDEDELDLDPDFDQPAVAAAAGAAAGQQLQEEGPQEDSSSSSGGAGAARTAKPPSSKSRGGRVQTGPARIAAELQLPLKRCQVLLQRAMRNLPFAHDPRPLEVLYEDSDLIVVNKPPGYHTAPVHRWQTGSMVNLLLSHLAAQGQANAKPYVLHRLDQYTSGVLLFAKRREVVPGIAQQFRERKVSKEYLAITVGVPPAAQFAVDADVDQHPTINTARRAVPPQQNQPQVQRQYPQQQGQQAVNGSSSEAAGAAESSASTSTAAAAAGGSSGTTKGGYRQMPKGPSARPALTSFRLEASNELVQVLEGATYGELFHERGRGLLEQQRDGAGDGGRTELHSTPGTTSQPSLTGVGPLEGAALVRCYPKTGRTHQIRLHLAYLGHPLLGDEVYGVMGPWLSRQALHAAALEVTHPLTGKRLRFEAPMPDDMKGALQALGIEV